MSCWDNETDIEDDSGNFLFANIDGDSASVICLNDDEAVELIQRWKAKEVVGNNNKTGKSKISQQESSSKPGSDGTYEIVDGDEVTATNDEHIYESIEDCTPEYQLFIGNDNTSPVHTPSHVPTTALQRQVSRKSAYTSKSKRSNSMPVSNTLSPKFTRKYSDCSAEYSRLKRRQNLSMDGSCTNGNNSSRPLPGLPPPLPPPNSVYTSVTSSSDYSQLYGRLNGKLSPDKDTSPPPSMILKHKGKSYVLPITENSGAGKQPNRDKAKRQSSASCTTTPKHVPNSSPVHYTVPRSVSMGFQCTPSKNQSNVDTTPRRKSKHSSSRSTPHHTASAPSGPATLSQPNKSQVTLYGVL